MRVKEWEGIAKNVPWLLALLNPAIAAGKTRYPENKLGGILLSKGFPLTTAVGCAANDIEVRVLAGARLAAVFAFSGGCRRGRDRRGGCGGRRPGLELEEGTRKWGGIVDQTRLVPVVCSRRETEVDRRFSLEYGLP